MDKREIPALIFLVFIFTVEDALKFYVVLFFKSDCVWCPQGVFETSHKKRNGTRFSQNGEV